MLGKTKEEKELEAQVLTDSQKQAFTKYFIDGDETLVSSLGNRYIENFIANGTLENGFSVISNKRVYFRGSCLTGNGKSFIKSDEERVVDIRDVTGSGFIYQREIGILVGIGLLILVLLAGMGFLGAGWSSRGSGYSSSDLKRVEQQLKADETALEAAQKALPAQDMEEFERIVAEYGSNSGMSNPWYSWYNSRIGGSIVPLRRDSREFFLQVMEDRDAYEPDYRIKEALFRYAFPEDEAISTENLSRYDDAVAAFYKASETLGNEAVFLDNDDQWVRTLLGTSDFRFDERGDDTGALRILVGSGAFPELSSDTTNEEFAKMLADSVTTAKAEMTQLLALSKPADYEETYQNALEQIAKFEEEQEAQKETIAALTKKVKDAQAEIPILKGSIAQSRKTNLLYFAGEAVLGTALVTVVLLFVNYLRRRRTLFEINYAGGKIAFNVSLYPKEEITDFQKQLRRTKDLVGAQTPAQPVPVPVAAVTQAAPAPVSSTADELAKYVALLEKGVITQEEFETLKKKAIE